jgi:hypothetical protein
MLRFYTIAIKTDEPTNDSFHYCIFGSLRQDAGPMDDPHERWKVPGENLMLVDIYITINQLPNYMILSVGSYVSKTLIRSTESSIMQQP